ncbi:MAG: class I SAM-dependent methyltransferase [Bacteriovoracaceae bacterium]
MTNETIKRYKHFADNFLYTQKYNLEFRVLDTLSTLSGKPLRNKALAKTYGRSIIREVFKVMNQDAENFTKGIYPESLKPKEDLLKHLKSFSLILKDYPSVIWRRYKNKTTLDDSSDYPQYFNRSFHFQTDGYTSEHSARLYEHQVEILFGGMANVMRRAMIEPLQKHLKMENPLVLEIAAGTGIGSRILSKVYPKAHITATDISEEYIQYSKEKFSDYKNIEFLAQDATSLTYECEIFDLTFQIFLLHELPEKERKLAIEEQVRVTKKDGLVVIIESLQTHDAPEWKEILEDFPRKYHEPFYRNYIANPIEPILEELGVEIISHKKVLFSKVILGRKKG